MIKRRTKRVRLWLVAPLLVAVMSSNCGEDPEVLEYGAGIGGAEVGMDLTRFSITKASGEVIASTEYDPGFWTDVTAQVPGAANDSVLLVLARLEEGLTMTFLRVIGRSDTACRFQAAVLARDEDYQIDDSGDFLNALEVKIHRVDLHQGSDYQTYYCADLKDRNGIFITVGGSSAEALTYKQVHAVINALRIL